MNGMSIGCIIATEKVAALGLFLVSDRAAAEPAYPIHSVSRAVPK